MATSKLFDISAGTQRVFNADVPIKGVEYVAVYTSTTGLPASYNRLQQNLYTIINDTVSFTTAPKGKILRLEVTQNRAELINTPSMTSIVGANIEPIKKVAEHIEGVAWIEGNYHKIDEVLEMREDIEEALEIVPVAMATAVQAKDLAVQAGNKAEQARVIAEQARDEAGQSKTDALTSAQEAKVYKEQADLAKQQAEAQVVLANQAVTQAGLNANASQTSANVATIQADKATSEANKAKLYTENSGTLKDETQDIKTQTEALKNQTNSIKTEVETLKSQTQTIKNETQVIKNEIASNATTSIATMEQLKADTTQLYTETLNVKNSAISEVNQSVVEAQSNLDSTKTEAIQNINSAVTNAQSQLESIKTETIQDIDDAFEDITNIRTDVEGLKDDTVSAKNSAESSKNLAYKWANHPENEEVLNNEYSAYHWAKKAQAVANAEASAITYNNTNSGMNATDVQDAIDELSQKTDTELYGEVKFALGFKDHLTTSLSYTKHTFTLSFNEDTDIYKYGKKYKFFSSDSITIDLTNETGTYYVYLDVSDRTLKVRRGYPKFDEDILVTWIYKNTIDGIIWCNDERHLASRNIEWHKSHHQETGASLLSGGSLTWTNSATDLKLHINTPIRIADEELVFTIRHNETPTLPFEQSLDGANVPVLYLDENLEYKQVVSSTPNCSFLHDDKRAVYNDAVNGGLKRANSVSWICYWLLYTTDFTTPVKMVLGRQTHSTRASAEDEPFEALGLEMPEFVGMAKVIIKVNDTLTVNPAKAVICNVMYLSEDSALNNALAPTNHANLAGRDKDNQHPISAITDLGSILDNKADKGYVNTAINTLEETVNNNLIPEIALKADKTYVDNGLSIRPTNVTFNNALALKADKTELTDKATFTYVANAVADKALKSYVDTLFNTLDTNKAELTLVNNALALKADKTELTNGLALKLNANANAVSATILQTARKINGVLFNGSGDITVYDSTKQPTLVSGTNIKTIDGVTLLGSGNIATQQTTITGNAGTATKLQTARSINGTNFDGTGNITTAQWGTARTLTATGGATGSVSINGSANVSLALTLAGATQTVRGGAKMYVSSGNLYIVTT